MGANSTFEASNLTKLPLVEVEEGVPPPAYDAIDAETAVPNPSPEIRPSRAKALFFSTAAFTITTLIFCLYGSLAIGFPYDEREAAFKRVTFASILGGIILGPVYFTSKGFVTFASARHEVINNRIANGKLFRAFGHSVILCAVVIAVVASAASLGYGLVFRQLVYSDSVPTEKMVLDAVLVPVACLIGGIRWAYEMLNISMWVLVRMPKISTGFEGAKHDRLVGITATFTVFRFMAEGVVAAWPLCVLFIRPGLRDKCVAYYDRYRGCAFEVVGSQPDATLSV